MNDDGFKTIEPYLKTHPIPYTIVAGNFAAVDPYGITALPVTVLIALHQLFSWKVAEWSGAPVPFAAMAPALVISILVFPLTAWLAGRLDQWRLGRRS